MAKKHTTSERKALKKSRHAPNNINDKVFVQRAAAIKLRQEEAQTHLNTAQDALAKARSRLNRSRRTCNTILENVCQYLQTICYRKMRTLNATKLLDPSKKLPRKRYCSKSYVSRHVAGMKKYQLAREARAPVTQSLNEEDLCRSVISILDENEMETQGLDLIELDDYDKESNEGESYCLETDLLSQGLKGKRKRRKNRRSANGKRGNKSFVLSGSDDFEVEDPLHDNKYQFCYDLQSRDKNPGKL